MAGRGFASTAQARASRSADWKADGTKQHVESCLRRKERIHPVSTLRGEWRDRSFYERGEPAHRTIRAGGLRLVFRRQSHGEARAGGDEARGEGSCANDRDYLAGLLLRGATSFRESVQISGHFLTSDLKKCVTQEDVICLRRRTRSPMSASNSIRDRRIPSIARALRSFESRAHPAPDLACEVIRGVSGGITHRSSRNRSIETIRPRQRGLAWAVFGAGKARESLSWD